MNDNGCGPFLLLIALFLIGGALIIEDSVKRSPAPQEDVDRIISSTKQYPQIKPLVKKALDDDHFSNRELQEIESKSRKLKLGD